MRGLEIDLTLYTHSEICRYYILSSHNYHLFHEVQGIVQLVLQGIELQVYRKSSQHESVFAGYLLVAHP